MPFLSPKKQTAPSGAVFFFRCPKAVGNYAALVAFLTASLA